jgi:ubiquinone/menaquinone biosynthesis C-methylase UbiE
VGMLAGVRGCARGRGRHRAQSSPLSSGNENHRDRSQREMLKIARQRSVELARDIDLREGDAHQLPFGDGSFHTVVCTYSLCNIPDPKRAVSEMRRVLRPGGKPILVDHIRSAVKPIFWFQKLIEFFSMRLEGEHMTRRPLKYVEEIGFDIIQRDRLGPANVVERLVALKP